MSLPVLRGEMPEMSGLLTGSSQEDSSFREADVSSLLLLWSLYQGPLGVEADNNLQGLASSSTSFLVKMAVLSTDLGLHQHAPYRKIWYVGLQYI